MNPFKKIILEPGFLFPVANVFVFAQTGNLLALSLAIANCVFSAVAVTTPTIKISPLRITSAMVFLMAVCSFWSGNLLAGIAGLLFSLGHALVSSERIRSILKNPATPSLKKAFLHPTISYGFGSMTVGLMAGGGLDLLRHPTGHLPALLTVCSGMTAILTASIGLALNLLQAAIPFWILAAGVAINGLAGLLAGNPVGATNCFFAACGNLRLGWLHSGISQQGK